MKYVIKQLTVYRDGTTDETILGYSDSISDAWSKAPNAQEYEEGLIMETIGLVKKVKEDGE